MNVASRSRGAADGSVLVERAASLRPDAASPGVARRLLQEALGEAGRDRWFDAAALALSEVVTNAALHAHTAIEVVLRVHDEHLLAEVGDSSPGLPQQRRYDAQATTGRGMALVAALTDECGAYSLGSSGKVVWFRLGDRDDEPSAEDLLDAWDLDGDLDGLDGQTVEPDPTDDAVPQPAAPVVRRVVLRQLPVTLWLAARQHHDALLRELVLYLAEHDDEVAQMDIADAARNLVMDTLLIAVADAQQAGTARSALPPGHPAPLPPVPTGFDLELDVPEDLGAGFGALQDALDAAERLATHERLLARPGLPEVVAVRDWLCEQVVAQLAGQPSIPWGGTDQVHFATVADRSGAPRWDPAQVVRSARGVVAADDANRIVAVSEPLAALLGWASDDLVGRRIVALIPPALREAHVAGFTRHLATGEAHILGVPLTLPVLHADGRELMCRFMVERAAAVPGGRAVYLAWIEPVPDDAGGAEPV